jgi:hypothetical protein
MKVAQRQRNRRRHDHDEEFTDEMNWEELVGQKNKISSQCSFSRLV